MPSEIPPSAFHELLAKCQVGPLSQTEMRDAINLVLTGSVDEQYIREFLLAVAQRGESVAELSGAALAMRDSMQRIECGSRPVVDTCGTGGDGTKTFNISTAAALVVAACGVRVAKHGNRKITSSTGSADVLSELGINLEASLEQVQSCMDEAGICFCFAPVFHPAMRHVGPVRRSIDGPTIFNRLGPLSNPALADCQVLGVGDATLTRPMAETLQQLNTQSSIVVRGEDGVDEISLSAATRVYHVTADTIQEHRWSPEDFGIERADRSTLFADSPSESAACIREILSGATGPKADVVILNAAAGLWLAGVSTDLKRCAETAREALASGKAQRVVESLAKLTQGT